MGCAPASSSCRMCPKRLGHQMHDTLDASAPPVCGYLIGRATYPRSLINSTTNSVLEVPVEGDLVMETVHPEDDIATPETMKGS